MIRHSDRLHPRRGGRAEAGGARDRAHAAAARDLARRARRGQSRNCARSSAASPSGCSSSRRSSGRPAAELRRTLEIITKAEQEAEARQEGADRGQPAPGGQHRQALYQSRPAVPGSDPGRQHRPDEGGGQVRIPARLQVLDLRHLVGAAGHHARHRRPGAHHPHPGAHDRDHQQADPHVAPAGAGAGPRTHHRRAGQAHGAAGVEGAQGAARRAGADFARNAGGRRGRIAPGRFHRRSGAAFRLPKR